MILREVELYEPLRQWLKTQGFRVLCEVCNIDIIAIRGDEFWAIEMKMSLTKKVIRQAYSAKLRVDKAFVAIPTNPKSFNIEICRKSGIGIIRINNGICEMLLDGTSERYWAGYDKWRKIISNFEEGGVAGKPCLKGEGVTHDCLRRIKEYLEIHPEAKWKEIYENVGTHYSSPQSLAGSMRTWLGFYLSTYKSKLKQSDRLELPI